MHPLSDQPGNDQPWFAQSAPAQQKTPANQKTAIVIGAGLAGCALTHALDQSGWSTTLIDQGTQLASHASGNTRGVLKPHVTRTPGPLNRFNLLAFARTLEKLRQLVSAGHAIDHELCGVLQLVDTLGNWPPLEHGRPVDAATASKLLAMQIESPALYFAEGGWVDAAGYCRALIADCVHATVRLNTVVSESSPVIDTESSEWCVTVKNVLTQSCIVLESKVLVIATGAGTPPIGGSSLHADMGITIVAGQTTRCRHKTESLRPNKIISGKRFFIPDGDVCTIGATYQRNSSSLTIDESDTAENLNGIGILHPDLPNQLDPITSWRGLRAATPDRLPVAGSVPDFSYYRDAYRNLRHGPRHQHWPAPQYKPGLYIMSGFGSRGIVTSALCAELLANLLNGSDDTSLALSPGISAEDCATYQKLIHPARFLIRELRRQTT